MDVLHEFLSKNVFSEGPLWWRNTQPHIFFKFVLDVLGGEIVPFLFFWVWTVWGALIVRPRFSPHLPSANFLQRETVTSRVVVFWLGTECEQVFKPRHDEAGARETSIITK